MTSVILRRRKLGRGSTNGITSSMRQAVKVVRNFRPRDVRSVITPPPYLFRWGCTSETEFPRENTVVVNTSESIHWCSDKKQGRLDMQTAGVPVPHTVPYDEHAFEGNEFLESTAEERSIRWVARPRQHAQGRNLFVGNYYQCQEWLGQFRDGYISKLIEKVAEYRVFVGCNRVVWVAKKTPADANAVAWNVARGGRFDNVRWDDWDTKVMDAALKAAKVSGTDFCGVDVMVDAEGNPYVLEVNSAPSQTSPYRQSCVAKFFDYIIANGKEHFSDIQWNPRRTWKSYIHPVIRGDGDGGASLSID